MTLTHHHTNAKPHGLAGFGRLAAIAGLLLGLGLAAGPAAADADASSRVSFGSKLDRNVQPSNSLPARQCPDPSRGCTWIQREGYHKQQLSDYAPRNGVIRRIRVIAGGPGVFRPVTARVREGNHRTRLMRRGPRLEHEGQVDPMPGAYRVERFNVRIPVRRGDRLGIMARDTSMIRCSSGGPNTLVFQPMLRPRQPFQSPDETSGCWLLIQAVVR